MEPEWFDPNVQTLSSHLWPPKAQAFLAEQDRRVSIIFLNQKQVGTSCSSLEMLGCFLRKLGIRQGCEPSPTERIQHLVSVKAAGKGDRCRLFSNPITEREITPVSPWRRKEDSAPYPGWQCLPALSTLHPDGQICLEAEGYPTSQPQQAPQSVPPPCPGKGVSVCSA